MATVASSSAAIDSQQQQQQESPTLAAPQVVDRSQMTTKPDNLGPSRKRQRQGPSVYRHLLPLVPATVSPTPQNHTAVKPSWLSSFASTLPHWRWQPPEVEAWYDDLTNTVWVTQQDDMKLLWQRGFFGKGTLSRSEPSWKQRVENKLAQLEGRQQNLTSEEYTALRRVERKAEKLVKQKEREAEKLAAAAARGLTVTQHDVPSSLKEPVNEDTMSLELSPEADEPEQVVDPEERPPAWHLEAEHLQLQPEEAFFLIFAVGCVDLRKGSMLESTDSDTTTTSPMTILKAWQTFLHDIAIMNSPVSQIRRQGQLQTFDLTHDPRFNRFDSPFLINYAVYHHFRSMGWVTRSGVKFCCDWVLYGPGGPVGGHAEFSVVVVPNYADPQDQISSPFKSTFASDSLLGEGERKNSWRWFHTINRVCSGVKKTLVLLHVLIPPLSSLPNVPGWIAQHPTQAISKFEMREVTVRRFLAGRSRD
ncbi:tRNA splicing endonuclease subunit sen2 [Microbotryomycetes sp. JL221]|nr:tRNA splicing endonuclease subunit sen2 [Microbotryomycetes sp. JL221]